MMISEIKEPSGKDGLYRQEDVSILESVYSNTYTIFGPAKKRTLFTLRRSVDGNIMTWEMWRQKTN